MSVRLFYCVVMVVMVGMLLPVKLLRATTEAGALSVGITQPVILKGYVGTLNAFIYNTAPSGSDPLNYSVYEVTPYGNSPAVTGTKIADGGSGYGVVPFSFNSSYLNYGNNLIGATLTDTANNYQVTQSTSVSVLEHARPAFVIGGNEYQLASQPQPPAADNPVADPYAFGATGGGEFTSAQTPSIIADPLPNTPVDDMNLDSITASGDSQITITLPDFVNLPPDDPAASPAWSIDVSTAQAGLFNTVFELNYSDQQNLPGADAPGSEHAYFLVTARVTPAAGGISDVTIWITTPEPSSLLMVMIGFAALALFRRRKLAGK